jgi:hypothetical protein
LRRQPHGKGGLLVGREADCGFGKSAMQDGCARVVGEPQRLGFGRRAVFRRWRFAPQKEVIVAKAGV